MDKMIITKVSEFIDYVEKYKGNFYFRGQANSEWNIKPSLFRDIKKLSEECANINETYVGDGSNIIKKVLRNQHYGYGSRLCDITINPLVALYFAIEDESFDNKDGVVYIFDKTADITLDSLELKILLFLLINNINDLKILQSRIFNIAKTNYSLEYLKSVINSNYTINYDINLSYSNNRALLQGGTGIFFGFGVKNNEILRSGNCKITSMCSKIIIPSNRKQEIRRILSDFGIGKEILYDISNKYNSKLCFTVKVTDEDRVFKKLILDVIVSDVLFIESNIYDIVDEIYKEKTKYYSNYKIYMYVYYDHEDMRSYNWIAMPSPTEDLKSFILNYNSDYYIKRMINLNNEISINTIFEKTEIIINKCKDTYRQIVYVHDEYFSNTINRDEYYSALRNIKSILAKFVYFDLQSLNRSRSIYDSYYNNSNNYCISVIDIVEEQMIFLTRNEDNKVLEFSFNAKSKKCIESLRKLEESYKVFKQ